MFDMGQYISTNCDIIKHCHPAFLCYHFALITPLPQPETGQKLDNMRPCTFVALISYYGYFYTVAIQDRL